MIYKNGSLVQESVARIPLVTSNSVSIGASSSGSVTLDVPQKEVWYIKSLTITKGTNVTVDTIDFDGNDISQTDSVSDLVAEYGDLLSSEQVITVSGTNAGAGSESLEISIKGYKMR